MRDIKEIKTELQSTRNKIKELETEYKEAVENKNGLCVGDIVIYSSWRTNDKDEEVEFQGWEWTYLEGVPYVRIGRKKTKRWVL